MKTLKRLLTLHLDMCDQFRGLADQVSNLGTELDGAHKTVAQLQEKCAGLEEKLRERTAAPAQADALAAIKILRDEGYVWTGVEWAMQQPVPAPAMPVPDVAGEPGKPAIPPKPEGDDWLPRDTRPPRDKSAIVQALLFDGSKREAPARELEWSLRSGGVAWWRLAL